MTLLLLLVGSDIGAPVTPPDGPGTRYPNLAARRRSSGIDRDDPNSATRRGAGSARMSAAASRRKSPKADG